MKRWTMNRPKWSGALAAVAVLAAACGGSDDGGGQAGVGECDLAALDEAVADGPVQITFWIGMGGDNAQLMEDLTNEFNESQDRVEVRLVNNNGDREQQEKYQSGLTTGDLPDLVQHENIFLRKLIDSETVLPMQACIEAAEHDQSDYIERMIDYYVVDDVQWGLPFNINTPVLFYDRGAFEDAGLDPDDPPSTLEELYEYAEAIRDAGRDAGMGIKEDGWLVEVFRALQGEPMVDNGNGREGRATETVFNDELGLEIFTVLNDLVQDDLAETNPTEGSDRNNNLFGVGNGQWGMTFDSSGSIGPSMAVLRSGQMENVDPDVAPLPGLAEGGGVPLGGGGLFISSDDPARQAAAWEFTQFLTSPETQATWAGGTGFIPVRESALEEQAYQDALAEMPQLRVAYDQVLAGEVNEASAGPVIGEYRDLRRIVEQTLSSMFRGELTPEEAVEQAADQIDDSIQTYNERLGVE